MGTRDVGDGVGAGQDGEAEGQCDAEVADPHGDERTGLAYVNDPYGRPLQVVWEQWERIGDEKDLHITEHFDPRDFEVPGTRAHAALEYANRRIADMPRPATDPPTAALVLARKGSVPEALVESARAILDPELAEDILTTVYDYAAHPASERIVLNELRYRLEPLLAIGAGGLHREALSQLREHGRLDRGLYEKLHETYAWASHIAPVVKSQSADPDPEGLIRAHGLPEGSPDVKRLRLHSDTLYSLERMMDELEGLLDDDDAPARIIWSVISAIVGSSRTRG